jgi:hypothetical protein
LSGNFEMVFEDLMNTPSILMFNIDESKTTIVDADGNIVSMSQYLGMMKGIRNVPWTTRLSLGACFSQKESDDLEIPRLRLIYLDGSRELPVRVYALVRPQ